MIRLKGTKIQWLVQWVVTMGVVLFSWVFFRAENIDQSLLIIEKIFTYNYLGVSFSILTKSFATTNINYLRFVVILVSIVFLEISELWKFNNTVNFTLLIWLIIIFGAYGQNEFIYFQF